MEGCEGGGKELYDLKGGKKASFFSRFNIKQKGKRERERKGGEKRDGGAANHESFIDIHISMCATCEKDHLYMNPALGASTKVS